MEILLFVSLLLILVAGSQAQKYVTSILGITVNSVKWKMVKKQ